MLPGVTTRPDVGRSPRFASLLRESVIYAIGPMLGKVAAVVLLPIVTRQLAPESFGRLDVFSAAFSAATATLLLGFDVASARLFQRLDAEQRKRLFATWLLIAVFLGFGVLVLGFFFSGEVSTLLMGSSGFNREAWLLSPIVAGALVMHVALGVLRNHGRAWTYALFSSASILGSAILVVILVLQKAEVRSVLLAQACATVVVGVAAILSVWKSWSARPSHRLASELLRVGVPLAPIAAVVALGEVMSRGLVLRIAGPDETGYLSVAVRVASVLIVAAMAIQTGWHPRAFALARHHDGKSRVGTDITRIATLAPLLGALLAVAVPTIVDLVSGQAYSDAVRPAGWLIVAASGFVMAQLCGVGLLIDGRSSRLTISAIAGVAVTVAATAVLAGRYGATGGAAAAAIGQWTYAGLAWWLSRSSFRPDVAPWQLVAPSAAAAAMALSFTTPGASMFVRAASVFGVVFVAIRSGVVLDTYRIVTVELPDRFGRRRRG